jgi:hypothetical protein
VKLAYLALSVVAGAISIPVMALAAYALWLYPGCRHALGGLLPLEVDEACAPSNLFPGLMMLGLGSALLATSVLAFVARRRRRAGPAD